MSVLARRSHTRIDRMFEGAKAKYGDCSVYMHDVVGNNSILAIFFLLSKRRPLILPELEPEYVAEQTVHAIRTNKVWRVIVPYTCVI